MTVLGLFTRLSRIEDVETKRVLVKEITDALEKAYRIPRQAYVVTIREKPPENVGVGGILNNREPLNREPNNLCSYIFIAISYSL